MYRYHYHYHYDYQYYYYCYCHFVIIIVIIYFCITQYWRRKGQDKTINDTIINNVNKKRQFRKAELGKETTLKQNAFQNKIFEKHEI